MANVEEKGRAVRDVKCPECGKVILDVDCIDGLEVDCPHCEARFFWAISPENGELELERS
jgi:phage FluMu protein Com